MTNSSDQAQQVAVDVEDWLMSADGGLTFLPSGATATSANPWIELGADAFTLPARSERQVRISYRIPPAGVAGTYRSAVLFRVVPPSDEAGTVRPTVRIGFLAYVTVAGTETQGSQLVDFYQENDKHLMLVVDNTGNTVTRLSGGVSIRNEAGDEVVSIPVDDVPVLRESERNVRVELPDGLPSGFYVAVALVQDRRGGLLAGELSLEVP